MEITYHRAAAGDQMGALSLEPCAAVQSWFFSEVYTQLDCAEAAGSEIPGQLDCAEAAGLEGRRKAPRFFWALFFVVQPGISI